MTAARVRRALFALLALALVGGLVHAFDVSASESLYTTRGTFAFWVAIHEPVIRDFPRPAQIGEPTYHYSCGDGNTQPEQNVSFWTTLSPATAFERARRHIESHGFVMQTSDAPRRASFVAGRTSVELVVTSRPNRANVDATLLYPYR